MEITLTLTQASATIFDKFLVSTPRFQFLVVLEAQTGRFHKDTYLMVVLLVVLFSLILLGEILV